MSQIKLFDSHLDKTVSTYIKRIANAHGADYEPLFESFAVHFTLSAEIYWMLYFALWFGPYSPWTGYHVDCHRDNCR